MEGEKSGNLGYVGWMTYRQTYGKRKKAIDRGEWMVIKREAKIKLKGQSRK